MRPLKFEKRSIFRLLPALFVVLLPFSLLDQALLEVQYSLRGPRPPSQRMVVLRTQANTNMTRFVEEAWKSGFRYFINFDHRHTGTTGVLDLSLNGMFSQKAIDSALYPPLNHYLLEVEQKQFSFTSLIMGPLASFRLANENTFAAKIKNLPNKADIVVFIPERERGNPQIQTPAGNLSPVEISLNVISNIADGVSLRFMPRYVQYVLSLIGMGIVVWLLYTFPTIITLALTLVLIAVHFVVATLVFDKMGLKIPVVGPWVTMLTVYLLGISDRLDRRDRQHWSLAMRTENLSRLDEMRSNFLSLVSHDLKTPIARMQSIVLQIMRGDFGAISHEQKQGLEKISSANGHLQRTVNALLLLSRIESRDIRLKREPTDLTELLSKAVAIVKTQADERNITFTTELEPLFLVDIDQALIAEVAANLIDNALKYSPTHSQITVRCGELENCPELFPPQPGVWFEIQDQGLGIPVADRKRVLEKFIRASNESTAADQAVKGTGLGLYLSSYFVKKHSGRLSLQSRVPGEEIKEGAPSEQYFSAGETGTVVRVTLPIDKPLEEG